MEHVTAPERKRPMILLRRLLGDSLRRARQQQHRTLREVSSSARVSLGYLSEVERGQKEASSELLASICDALGVPMSEMLREVSDELAVLEAMSNLDGALESLPESSGHGGVGSGRDVVVAA
jgi:transcriptional regulator with XRE-family HTH domain